MKFKRVRIKLLIRSQIMVAVTKACVQHAPSPQEKTVFFFWGKRGWGGGRLITGLTGRNSFFWGGIFCLEYPSRRNEKVNCHFVNYRLSFRKLQIFISQTTDSHFVSFHFVSFRFVSFPCFLVIFCVLLGKAFKYCVQCFLVKCFSGVLKVQTKFGLRKHR